MEIVADSKARETASFDDFVEEVGPAYINLIGFKGATGLMLS